MWIRSGLTFQFFIFLESFCFYFFSLLFYAHISTHLVVLQLLPSAPWPSHSLTKTFSDLLPHHGLRFTQNQVICQRMTWLWNSSPTSYLPSLAAYEMPSLQVAVSPRCLLFPNFLSWPILPLTSSSDLVWNIFSSLHPIGFKLLVIPTDFRPEPKKPMAAFHSLLYLSALGIVPLFPAWSFLPSSIHLPFEFIPVFGVFCCNTSCVTAVCLEQRRAQSTGSLSSPLPFFSALGFHV